MYDTKQFRRNAERCEQLALSAASDTYLTLFLDIAVRWRRLADEIDAEMERPQSEQTERKLGSAS